MKLPESLELYRERVEAIIEHELGSIEGPPTLLEAMRYSTLAGGKRIRGILALATRDLFGFDAQNPGAERIACAVEMIHTYSLIHDDLPAMDDDDMRRGKPSNHVVFGEAMAILAGDALLTEAFRIAAKTFEGMADARAWLVVAELAHAAGAAGMVGGQVLDISAEGHSISQEELERLHRMKTGALISAPVRIAAMLGGATEDELDALSTYASNLGLAFQVVDDVLDVIADEKALGKTVGKDAKQGKTTYVNLMGVEAARKYAMELGERAIAAISRWGSGAGALSELARFVVQRMY